MNVARYRKGVAAVIGALATAVFAVWGADWGLPPDWPETVTAALTPLAVILIPNEA